MLPLHRVLTLHTHALMFGTCLLTHKSLPTFIMKTASDTKKHAQTYSHTYTHIYTPGLFNSFFGEQGFDKVRERSKIVKLFKGFDVQFWETDPWAPPPTFKTSRLDVYVGTIVPEGLGYFWAGNWTGCGI